MDIEERRSDELAKIASIGLAMSEHLARCRLIGSIDASCNADLRATIRANSVNAGSRLNSRVGWEERFSCILRR